MPVETSDPLPDPVVPDPPSRKWTWGRAALAGRGLAYRTAELIGMVPLVAPLGAAGYYQADLAHHVFGWTYPWAYVFPAAIEGGAAYAATLYHRKLVAGDSTVGARIGMLTYAAASSALLYWHARDTGRPWQAAAGIAAMTVAAVWIWTQRARWHRRAELRRRGLIDTQAPRFSVLRWFACPIETPRAYRYAIKYGLSDPRTALDAYRTHRAGGGPPSPAPVRRTPTHRIPDPQPIPAEMTAAAPSRLPTSDDDGRTLAQLRREYPGRTPSLNEIQQTLGCGRSRAVRLKGLLDADQSDDQEPTAVGAVTGGSRA